MSDIYCGNNAKSNDILNGNKVIGTRYGCLRKGIGKGKNSPVDNNYIGEYQAIDTRKIYCGKSENLPNGYDLMGNLPQCLQKGIGIGKKQKAIQYKNHEVVQGQQEKVVQGQQEKVVQGQQEKVIQGQQEKVIQGQNRFYKIIIYMTIYIILCTGIFLALYFTKPNFISDKKNNTNVVNTKKLLIYYIPIIVVLGFIVLIISKII